MKKFNITVNGTAYEVEVEELGGAVSAAPKAAAPVAAGATAINAPMPGKVTSVAVKVGDAVKAGDVLMILEAMKMQNEIMAPADGTVTDVRVTAGQNVNTGDPMIVL
jgi:glutaconyl-CoA decarboxylase